MNVFRGLYGTCFETTCVRVCKLKAGVVFRNSELLRRAEAHFDLLITADQNIVYQQNLSGRPRLATKLLGLFRSIA